MEEVDWFEDENDEGSGRTLRGRARAHLPVLALGFMLASAVSVAAIGGAVATGVGESSFASPTGFTFSVDRSGDTAAVVITHQNGSVPNPDRVYVVDDAGTEVPWTDLGDGTGTARITGDSGLACPRQGATVQVVFHDKRFTETIDSYEVAAPVPASVVDRCEAAG